MNTNQLKTYYEQFNQDNPLIFDELIQIAEAYEGEIQKEVLLPVSAPVAISFLTSLGYQRVNGLLIRSVTTGDSVTGFNTHWSCFKVTEISKKPLVAISGVGQDPDFPDITSIPGAMLPVEFDSCRSVADIVLSGHNLPGKWIRKVIASGVDTEVVEFISNSLKGTGEINEDDFIDLYEGYSAIALGDVSKNHVLIATDISSGSVNKYDIHFLTNNELSQEQTFIERIKEVIEHAKRTNDIITDVTATADDVSGHSPSVTEV